MKGEPVFGFYQKGQQMDHFFNRIIQDIQKGLEKYPNTLRVYSEQLLEFKDEKGQSITIVITEGSLKSIYDYFDKIPPLSGRPERNTIISEDDIINLKIALGRNEI